MLKFKKRWVEIDFVNVLVKNFFDILRKYFYNRYINFTRRDFLSLISSWCNDSEFVYFYFDDKDFMQIEEGKDGE